MVFPKLPLKCRFTLATTKGKGIYSLIWDIRVKRSQKDALCLEFFQMSHRIGKCDRLQNSLRQLHGTCPVYLEWTKTLSFMLPETAKTSVHGP